MSTKATPPAKIRLGSLLSNPISGLKPEWEKDGDDFDLDIAMNKLRGAYLGAIGAIAEQHTKEKILPFLVLDGIDHSSQLAQAWAKISAYVTSVNPDRAVYKAVDGGFYMIKRKV